MEFKDKLKTLRREHGLTQAQLAEAIFVSRSTVAKWENGLGFPGPESQKALEEYFSVSRADIATTEPEAVIVQKNRTLRLIFQAAGWTVFIVAMVLSCFLAYGIHNNRYGFTADMAAGTFADNPCIDTGDYRIYYSAFEGDWEDGRHWVTLSAFMLVRKQFLGYTVCTEEFESRLLLRNNYVVGRLYSVEGKNGHYHLIKNIIGNDMQEQLVTVDTVITGGTEYDVQHGFFFVTQGPVELLKIGDIYLDVE